MGGACLTHGQGRRCSPFADGDRPFLEEAEAGVPDPESLQAMPQADPWTSLANTTGGHVPSVGPDLQALRHMLCDLQTTVATQISAGEKVDEKAARIIGWNGLLLGLVVASASLAIDRTPADGIPPGGFLLISGGLVAVLVSVFSAIITYRATEFRPGLEPEDLVEALDYDIDEGYHLRKAIEGYRAAHDGNKKSLDGSSKSFQVALFSFFGALVLLAAGTTRYIWAAVQSP